MELILAIVGPILGGAISLVVWQSKNNSERIQSSLTILHNSIEQVDGKLDDMSIDNVKNFATKTELIQHEEREEDRNEIMREEIKEIRDDIKDIKESQWKIILNNNKSI